MILLHNDGGRSSLSMSRDHRLRVCNQSVFFTDSFNIKIYNGSCLAQYSLTYLTCRG